MATVEENRPTSTLKDYPLWQSACWCHAVTLTERLASLRGRAHDLPAPVLGNTERARRLLQRWREQAPFSTAAFFAERLAMDGLSEPDLLLLLGEPIEHVQTRLSPGGALDWVESLAQAFGDTRDDASPPSLGFEAGEASVIFALLRPFQPLLAQGLRRLQASIDTLCQRGTTIPFDPHMVVSLLVPHLMQTLLPKVSRTLVLELHVARLQERLQGETAEERFQSYLTLLAEPDEMLALLEEYSVLARQVVETIDQWVISSLEFLTRLCADWEDLRRLFTPGLGPGALVAVRGGAGDTHRGGRSVMLLTFHSGFQLVYKPKSLAVDLHFQELLTWLNQIGQHPAFRLLTLLDRGAYGWSEFVAPESCTSEEEVQRFYEQQGGYLALLYALGAMDVHAENVIAAGEHPLLIDLEALFHPRLPIAAPTLPAHPARRALEESVLGVGLLPARAWSNVEAAGLDISGLGGQAGQMTPRAVPRWRGVGTDQMYLVRERVEVAVGHNRPRLNGAGVRTNDYADAIVTGFTRIYRLLIAQRPALLTEWLPRFAQDEIRCIARPTQTYALLLWESFHPNLLRDALKRDRFFDRLWVGVQQERTLARLIPAERADLLRGDIPMFTTCPASRDLFTSQGECLPDFFAEPSLELVEKRVRQLDEADLARQVRMIRASFVSMAPVDQAHVPGKQQPDKYAPAAVTTERLLLAARAVGERLREVALYRGDRVGWLGVRLVNEREWQLGLADQGLYAGTAGIALYFAYLGSVTGDATFTTLARSALRTARDEVEQLKQRPEGARIGAFDGLGSAIYLMTHLGVLWQEQALVSEAQELVKVLPDWVAQDRRLDIIAGSAGCIASLLCLAAVAPSPDVLKAAMHCGDHLLAQSKPMRVGLGWSLPWQATPLAGFAHGAAGIAWSLVRLAAASGQERFRRTAQQALAYERSLYSPEQHNWPALPVAGGAPSGDAPQQERAGDDVGMVAWCYGAAGIGLSRLSLLPYLDDPMLHQEIAIALQTTIRHGFGANHCLCHGDGGNLETVLLAAQVLDDPGYPQELERLAGHMLASIEARGWKSGVPFQIETPGLMTGLAGIGYALLRLVAPLRVPSVLLLAPPPR